MTHFYKIGSCAGHKQITEFSFFYTVIEGPWKVNKQ